MQEITSKRFWLFCRSVTFTRVRCSCFWTQLPVTPTCHSHSSSPSSTSSKAKPGAAPNQTYFDRWLVIVDQFFLTGPMSEKRTEAIHGHSPNYKTTIYLFPQISSVEIDAAFGCWQANFDVFFRMLFVKLSFTLATEEAERIGLDHVRLDTA